MNSFRKLIQNIDFIFSKVKYYFFITDFNKEVYLMIMNYCGYNMFFTFGVSKNERIECFVNKYLTIDQTMLPIEIHNMQIHQHKKKC